MPGEPLPVDAAGLRAANARLRAVVEARAARRHQAVSGYWHSLATLTRWCRIRSYLDSAAAHGVTELDAISGALAGKPWLPPLPAPA